MTGRKILLILLGLWLLVQFWSYWASSGIEGPRNLDTGFKRLDTLFKWQLLALGVAVFAAISAFVTADKRWSTRLIGLLPSIVTLTVVGVFALFVAFYPGDDTNPIPQQIPKTSAPATSPDTGT